MAQIENGGGNGKGKNHQKKMTIRVDFTPMVDMNMLLITFFMLCTTMIKTQTLNIALPSNKSDLQQEQMNQASAADAVTIILDAKRLPSGEVDTIARGTTIYYYEGKPNELKPGETIVNDSDPENVVVTMPAGQEKIKIANFTVGDPSSIRTFIQKRNKDVLEKIKPIREDFQAGKKTQAEFDSLAKIIRADENLSKPVIIIKATPDAQYGSLVSILDEMQINQIATYQIDNLSPTDEALIKDYQSRHK